MKAFRKGENDNDTLIDGWILPKENVDLDNLQFDGALSHLTARQRQAVKENCITSLQTHFWVFLFFSSLFFFFVMLFFVFVLSLLLLFYSFKTFPSCFFFFSLFQ